MLLEDGTELQIDPEDDFRTIGLTFRYDRHLKTVVRKIRAGQKVTTQTLAQFVMGGPAGEGMVWHHKNGDRLDYRQENLAVVPRGRHLNEATRRRTAQMSRERMLDPNENPKTRKGRYMMGVSKSGNRFRMRMKGQASSMHDTEEEAARAYDRARIAQGLPTVNFPEWEYEQRTLT